MGKDLLQQSIKEDKNGECSMRVLILLGDGMGDRPLRELDNKTPLEKARTPNMDEVAKNGI